VTEAREQALQKAILESGDRVVVLLTGKGRETRMKRGTLYIDTPSDVDFTLKYLGQYDNEVNGEKS
jgi:UDP-N-acetylmuramoyl-L-alanyl-D-glutamate--2,6-diaminopimelate ligase